MLSHRSPEFQSAPRYGLRLTFVLAPIAILIVGYPFIYVSGILRDNWQHIMLNHGLIVLLAFAFGLGTVLASCWASALIRR